MLLQPRAGWGAVVIQNEKLIHELFGPVVIDPMDVYYIGAEKKSNNTAELTAIMEVTLFTHSLTLFTNFLALLRTLIGPFVYKRIYGY